MMFKRGGNDYNPKGITLFHFVCEDNVVETFNSFDVTRTTTQLFLVEIDEKTLVTTAVVFLFFFFFCIFASRVSCSWHISNRCQIS